MSGSPNRRTAAWRRDRRVPLTPGDGIPPRWIRAPRSRGETRGEEGPCGTGAAESVASRRAWTARLRAVGRSECVPREKRRLQPPSHASIPGSDAITTPRGIDRFAAFRRRPSIVTHAPETSGGTHGAIGSESPRACVIAAEDRSEFGGKCPRGSESRPSAMCLREEFFVCSFEPRRAGVLKSGLLAHVLTSQTIPIGTRNLLTW